MITRFFPWGLTLSVLQPLHVHISVRLNRGLSPIPLTGQK